MAAARVMVPSIQLVSDYKIKGRALVVPIQGDGIFRANLSKYLYSNILLGSYTVVWKVNLQTHNILAHTAPSFALQLFYMRKDV